MLSANLKLLRKLSILTLLSAGLFFTVSADKTSASTNICCSTCDSNYILCIGECYTGDPGYLNRCLEECEEQFNNCYDGPPKCDSAC